MAMKRKVGRWLGVPVALFVAVRFAPEALAFPYSVTMGGTDVYSETPILGDQLAAVISRSDTKLRASQIFSDNYGKRIFLTDDGWRWSILALMSRDAFAVSFPIGGAIVINRANLRADLVTKDGTLANRRTLSGTIAHERTHNLIRARFGILADGRYPLWLREGYCDAVARESSLSDDQARRLIATDSSIPAVDYYQGRKRVERELVGTTVADLFERYRQF